MVMTVLMHDIDKRLRIHGVPTNTWSVGKPVYDLEYARGQSLRKRRPCANVDEAKYLGSQVTWTNPTKAAIEARK